MAFFGIQYYLGLIRKARSALRDTGALSPETLLGEAVKLHRLKLRIPSHEELPDAEERIIRRVVANADERSSEVFDIMARIMGWRVPLRHHAQAGEFRSLCATISQTPEARYCTRVFAKKVKRLQRFLSSHRKDGFAAVDVRVAESALKAIRTKGYTWNLSDNEPLRKALRVEYSVSGMGLPKNFLCSAFESNRRKH